MKAKIQKYIWLVPALYVSYEFGKKLFEVLADKQEFVSIISAIHPLAPLSTFLAYFIGFFDFFVAILLLSIAILPLAKKYSKYIFIWVILWPFAPSSLRYFGGVADFELWQVLSMSCAAILSYVFFNQFNRSRF